MKISIADKWDPEGYVRFEVDLPNSTRVGTNGFEIIAIWQSMVANEGIFYTDANGVELL